MAGALTSPGSSSSSSTPPSHPQQHLQRLPFDHSWSGPTATGNRETPVTAATATLTTQRSSFHRSRRSVPSFNLPSLSASPSSPSLRNPVVSTSGNASKQRSLADLSHPVRPDVNTTMPSSVAYSETRTLASDHARAWNGAHRSGTGPTAPDMDETRRKNEDIFLNIARDSDRRESLGRSDFRRSRLGYSGQSLRSPTTRYDEEQTPSPDQRFSNADSPSLSQNGSPTIPYSSNIHSSAASAHPLDDPGRYRYSGLASGPRSTIGVPRSRFNRTSPDTSPRAPSVNGERRSSIHESRFHRHSTLSTIRSSRQPSSSEVTERARGEPERSRADGTESTLSTTAPSTVWDELEDLKSRIRKLELTGKLPPSSQAAISGASNERPRTATTTTTTLSSSPKHGQKASTTVEGDHAAAQSQVHPLLQSALAKAKSVLSSDVYAALEATIADALNLSTLLGVNTAPSGSVSVVNGYSSSERQARRKADSVCRSLTELCLALTDEQLRRTKSPAGREAGTQPQPPNGAENESPRQTLPYQRSASHEPEGASERRPSTTRIASRLHARRTSVVNPSPEIPAETSPAQTPGIPAPTSRLNRMTSLRSRRPTAGEENGETRSPHTRSLSRAMTDTGTPDGGHGVSPRQRFTHERSSSRSISGAQHDQPIHPSPRSPQYQQPQQPQPSQQQSSSQQRTPTTSLAQSALPLRRSYISPGTLTPATSRSNIQAGSRRYGLSPGFSSAQGSSGEESPRSAHPEASQTRIAAPSSKMASSYTPIPQPRLRTHSLGGRRLGLRQSSPATPNDNVSHLDDSID